MTTPTYITVIRYFVFQDIAHCVCSQCVESARWPQLRLVLSACKRQSWQVSWWRTTAQRISISRPNRRSRGQSMWTKNKLFGV